MALPSVRDAARQGLHAGGLVGAAAGLAVGMYLLLACLTDMPWKDDIVLWLAFLGMLFGQTAMARIAGMLSGLCMSLAARMTLGRVRWIGLRIAAAVLLGGISGLLLGLGIVTMISGGREANGSRFHDVLLIGAWSVLGAVCGGLGSVRVQSIAEK
jgi:hypothetical protein